MESTPTTVRADAGTIVRTAVDEFGRVLSADPIMTTASLSNSTLRRATRRASSYGGIVRSLTEAKGSLEPCHELDIAGLTEHQPRAKHEWSENTAEDVENEKKHIQDILHVMGRCMVQGHRVIEYLVPSASVCSLQRAPMSSP